MSRTPSDKRQYAVNVGSGLLAQTVSVGQGLVLLPYVISRLGSANYGVYQLATSALAFFAFLQLGMGPTLIRFCSQAIAEDDHDSLSRTSSTSQLILGTLGLVGTAAILALIPFFLKFYDIPPDARRPTTILLVFMSGSFLLNMLFIAPNGFLLGVNRYDLANGVDITANLLRLGSIFFTFETMGPSLPLLGGCIFGAQVFRFVVYYVFALRFLGRSVLFRATMVCRASFRSLVGFSALNLSNTAAAFLVIQAPVLIIGRTLGVEAVTAIAPAILIAGSLQGFLGQLSRPLVPLASKALSRNDVTALGRFTVEIASITCCAGLAVLLPLCVYGNELVGLWLGPDMAHTWIYVAALAGGTIVSQVAAVVYFLALGGGDIRPTVFSQIALGVVITIGVAIGTHAFGWQLLGTVVFVATCRALRSVTYLPFAYAKQFHYTIRNYTWQVYALPSAAFLAAMLAGFAAKRLIPPGTFSVLVPQIMFLLIAFGVVAWHLAVPATLKRSVQQRSSILLSKRCT